MAQTRTRRGGRTAEAKTVVDKTAELSDDVLQSVERGQRAAIEAVRKFVDTVDQALTGDGAAPSKRQEIFDSAMEMSDRLVQAQYDFLRKVVDDAAKSLKRSGEGS